ncbi:hypothetical protein AB9K41_24510, partial [Cribrihabitans sp. XS_ASV171]
PALMATLCVGCTPQYVVEPTRRAHFDAFPGLLFRSFEETCTPPDKILTRPGTGIVECNLLMSPEDTAYVILRYDGYPQDLPTLVTRLSASQVADGYLVEVDAYLTVPQKSGPAVRVGFESPSMDRLFTEMLTRAGGEPR